MRGLIENMKRPTHLDQRTRLTAGAKADIAWWLMFVDGWNGVGLFPQTYSESFTQVVVSDASGVWGCGAFTTDPIQFFQLKWPQSWAHVNIAAKELLPIVASAALWGQAWSGKKVLFRCDNTAAVMALSARTARDPAMTHLLRCLFFLQAHFKFDYAAKHIPGSENGAADALSRNRLSTFLSYFPQAPQRPAEIPFTLLELLCHPSLTWTSVHWANLFKASLREASQTEPEVPTIQRRNAT